MNKKNYHFYLKIEGGSEDEIIIKNPIENEKKHKKEGQSLKLHFENEN